MSLESPAGLADPGEVRFLRLPAVAAPFRKRAERLAALAPGHAAGDFLQLMSRLCELQARVAGELGLTPQGRKLPAARPLSVAAAPPPEWRQALDRLLRGLTEAPMPPPAREAVQALGAAAPEERDRLATGVLRGELPVADLAPATFVGAALQVVYGGLASALPADLPRAEDGCCPVCGAPPVAGLVLGDDKLRYLCCSLCGAEWNLPRLHCAVCRKQDRVGYLAVEGDAGPAKAEACRECRVYTKLLYVEKAPRLEVGADDLATLALDLLLAEEGYRRNGRNLLLPTAA